MEGLGRRGPKLQARTSGRRVANPHGRRLPTLAASRPGTFDALARRRNEDERWEEIVARLDSDDARRLLVDAAEHSEDVARAVRLAAASRSERISVLRAEIDQGLRTRRYLSYRESSSWALDASPVVDALADAVASEPSRELVVLLERAVGHVVKVILRADDSDGMIGDLARRILELHERACNAGVAEPTALAKWMIRFNFDDQDFFAADPVRYAGALGEEGLAIFRREAGDRAAASSSFAARYALERLAVVDGDVERIVSLLGGDQSKPHQFIQVAEAMGEIGRTDDVLAWARRGIDTTTGWQVAKLFDLSVRVLDERGDTAGMLALRREHLERMPSAATYAALKSAAVAVGSWQDMVAAARAVLSARDRGGLVDALLADGDATAAWDVATADPDWEVGEQRWLRLAEAREDTDPRAAFGVYLRLADLVLVTTGRGQYQLASRRLKAAKRAAASAGLEAEFAAHIAALRETHRRRPTLITTLDAAGLR